MKKILISAAYWSIVGSILLCGCSSSEETTPIESTNTENPSTFSTSNQESPTSYGTENFTTNSIPSTEPPIENRTESRGIFSNVQEYASDFFKQPDPFAYLANIFNLDEEYNRVSKHTDGVQEEYKATINACNSAESLQSNPDDEKCQIIYEKRMDRLLEIRQENSQQGIPVGPDISKSSDLDWVIRTLRKNADVLSEKFGELRTLKGKVVEYQSKR